jgi:hypothetical protein
MSTLLYDFRPSNFLEGDAADVKNAIAAAPLFAIEQNVL